MISALTIIITLLFALVISIGLILIIIISKWMDSDNGYPNIHNEQNISKYFNKKTRNKIYEKSMICKMSQSTLKYVLSTSIEKEELKKFRIFASESMRYGRLNLGNIIIIIYKKRIKLWQLLLRNLKQYFKQKGIFGMKM